jgi:hypothetical protein
MRKRAGWLLGAAAALALGCGGEKKGPSGPTAGELTVSFTSLTGTDGALLLLVTGAVTSIQPVGSYQMSQAPAGVNATRLVLTGAISPGDILKLSVPDVDAASSYAVTIEAAADRNTFALADPVLYSTSLRK